MQAQREPTRLGFSRKFLGGRKLKFGINIPRSTKLYWYIDRLLIKRDSILGGRFTIGHSGVLILVYLI